MVKHIAIAKSDKLVFLFCSEVCDPEEIEDSIFHERYFWTHQVVKPLCLDHILELIREVFDFLVVALSIDVGEHIVEDISDHVDLLL